MTQWVWPIYIRLRWLTMMRFSFLDTKGVSYFWIYIDIWASTFNPHQALKIIASVFKIFYFYLTNTFQNQDKYISKLRKKYISKLRRTHFKIETDTFQIKTNTFQNWEKHISKLKQTHFKLREKLFKTSFLEATNLNNFWQIWVIDLLIASPRRHNSIQLNCCKILQKPKNNFKV